MRIRHPRVFDTSAIIALFQGHPALNDMPVQAEDGWWTLALPAVCVAEAEAVLRAGPAGWEAVLLTPGGTGPVAGRGGGDRDGFVAGAAGRPARRA